MSVQTAINVSIRLHLAVIVAHVIVVGKHHFANDAFEVTELKYIQIGQDHFVDSFFTLTPQSTAIAIPSKFGTYPDSNALLAALRHETFDANKLELLERSLDFGFAMIQPVAQVFLVSARNLRLYVDPH